MANTPIPGREDVVAGTAAALNWKTASKASICAFMLAFAPLTAALAQDGAYVAPAAASSDSTDGNYVAPADDAGADGQAAPVAPAAAAAAAAPAAPAPAAAVGVNPNSDTIASPSASTSAAAASVSASSAAPTTNLGSVSVTGSAIARSDAATALPVTTYSADSLRQQGITSTPQFLQQLSGNSTDAGPGLSTGTANTGGASFANLRGLGPNKTLILLDGRRVSVNALDGGATDLNTIPFAAIDHVEVLRDGASALYGTDAIGGVINFITKKNLQGGNVDLNYSAPTRSGGGTAETLSATFGKGDLQKDGWNILGTLSYQHQGAVNVNDRGFVVPLDPRIDATSAFTNPSNYVQNSTGEFINPSAAAGCNVRGEVNQSGNNCRENFSVLGGAEVVQEYEEPSFFGRGSYKINDNNQVALSYLWSRKVTRSLAAPAPGSGFIEVDPGTPFFPGNGIVAGPTAAQQASQVAAGADPFDPNSPVTAYYRSVPLGPRHTEGTNEYHRVVLNFTGQFLDGFHYDTAFSYNQASTVVDLVSGEYNQNSPLIDSAGNPLLDANGNAIIDPNSLQSLINAGQFNPFTANPTPAQLAALRSTETTGDIDRAKTRAYIWDGKVDHEIGNWFGAGESALALGAQYRHETLTDTVPFGIANRAPSTGFSGTSVDEDRDVEGVFGELNVPILQSLELDAQARYDNYSDVGDTVNPKVSLRYQPLEQLTLRASYGEGFHAPTLYDLYQPNVTTFTPGALNDPVKCPGGVPAPGAVEIVDCNTQFQAVQGGNKNLSPEKSKDWSMGFVLQPIKYVALTADFFAVELSQQIGVLDPSFIFANYNQFAGQFNRDPNTNSIISFTDTNSNLGKTETNGEDVQLNVSVPTDTGTYSLTMQGTYINKYDFQTAKDGPYTQNVSYYSNGNIFRWKHNVTLGWNKGPFALGVVNHYSSGYSDFNSVPSHPHVHDYVTWDTYGSYAFDNGIQLTVGSNNVFDVDPPFSIQSDAGNSGYDARYADGLGRTVYGRFSYSF